MASRSRLFIFGSVITPIALYFGASMTMDHFERQGWRFFDNGKDITTSLGVLSKALQSKDTSAIAGFYAADFSGSRLGLTTMSQAEEKDGIHKLVFRSDGGQAGRDAAVAEWKAYLDGFESIEEAGLHIHRLEKWDTAGDVAATIRYELIGTPKGASQAGIDRGYFKMRFDASAGGLKIRQASLVEGDRIIGDKPQFVDVAKTAGVDFLNQYYPAFLNQSL